MDPNPERWTAGAAVWLLSFDAKLREGNYGERSRYTDWRMLRTVLGLFRCTATCLHVMEGSRCFRGFEAEKHNVPADVR